MNRIFLMGRLTRDPEYKTSSNGKPYATYRLAVDRGGKDAGADFFDCITYDAGANFAQTYLHKGTKILVEGFMKYGEYTDKEGKRRETYTVNVQRHEFAESAGEDARPFPSTKKAEPKKQDDDFLNIPDVVDDSGLPFA